MGIEPVMEIHNESRRSIPKEPLIKSEVPAAQGCAAKITLLCRVL